MPYSEPTDEAFCMSYFNIVHSALVRAELQITQSLYLDSIHECATDTSANSRIGMDVVPETMTRTWNFFDRFL